ncbi:MAG TPA: Zn-ribbon domain-containing OB-fold protein [Actinomycetota bacterium]|nr:Zn-ribbon domain-containing OB-fold protein [Actinomycetota bacterium]
MTVRKIPGELPVRFRYTPGVANTTFFEALRDRGVLLGSRCSSCAVTYLPARLFCERCFAELTADVECGPEGTVESWTVGHVGVDDDPLDPPVILALVKLDGADTVLMHHLASDGTPAIGMRVRAIVRDDRSGSINDLEGFVPV